MNQRRDSAGVGSDVERPPDAELEVLACLWRAGSSTAREIREQMQPFRPMAHGSTVTLLKRLENKGLVARRKAPVGKAFIYRPTRPAEPTLEQQIADIVERIYGGRGQDLVAMYLKACKPGPKEIQAIQELIEDYRRQGTYEPS